MAARWDQGFDGAYPEGVDPRSRFPVAVMPWLLVVRWGSLLTRSASTVRAK